MKFTKHLNRESLLESKALPLEWLLDPGKAKSPSSHVLARLIQAEAHEPEVSLKDDYRIAQLIVIHCERGDAIECSPHVLATYEVLGCHPDDVYARTMIRRAAMFGTEVNRVKFPSKPSPKKTERKRA